MLRIKDGKIYRLDPASRSGTTVCYPGARGLGDWLPSFTYDPNSTWYKRTRPVTHLYFYLRSGKSTV